MAQGINKNVTAINLSDLTAVFSVRCVFQVEKNPRLKARRAYEERVTLWRAASFDKAIEAAEAETKAYIGQGSALKVLVSQAFQLYEPPKAFPDGCEVFSLIRSSDLAPKKYIERFFVTNREHGNFVASADPKKRA